MTLRDDVERVLLADIPQLQPLTPDLFVEVDNRKEGAFGFSIYGIQLYCNGTNAHSKSSLCPRGLVYLGDKASFGAGIFFKENDSTPYIFCVAPVGPGWRDGVEQFAQEAQRLLPDAVVYIRQLPKDKKKELFHPKVGSNPSDILLWQPGSALPWNEHAAFEDETFQHRLVRFDGLRRSPENGLFNTLPEGGDRGHNSTRKQARNNYQSFMKFLERNGLEIVIQDFHSQQQAEVESLVRGHFARLETGGKRIGSTPEDYENLWMTHPTSGVLQENLYPYIASLHNPDTGLNVPVGFFAFENLYPAMQPRTDVGG